MLLTSSTPSESELKQLVGIGPTIGQSDDYLLQLVGLLDSLAETPTGLQILSENPEYIRSLLLDVFEHSSLPISQTCLRVISKLLLKSSPKLDINGTAITTFLLNKMAFILVSLITSLL